LFGRNRDREKPVSKSAQKTGTGGKTFTNNKKTVIIAAVLAVALALLLAFGAIKIINLAAGDSKVTVPDVLGMTEEEAETALNKVGLKMELDEDGVYSDQYEEDLVAAQDPRAKLKAKKKSVVHVTLSLGSDNIEDLIAKLKELGVEIPANADRETLLKLIEEAESKIEIPDLNGKSQASAEYTASALGFKIGNVKYEDSDKPVDTVIAQSPSPGDIAKKGTKIDITLSQGPRSKEVDMPNLIKMSEADAKAKIEELHLVVGTVETKYSADYAKGTVMWQQFQIGAKLTEGQTVNIIVSLGPEEKESTVKIDVDFSGAPADSFKLSALQISPDGSQNYILRNQDRLQSQGSEIISATGKGAGWKVIVYFNDIQAKIYNIDFNTGKVS
jgi:serine/threonine-protein kinase